MKNIKNPNITQKILLHVCCAPCACVIINTLLDEGYKVDLFFYNPNIDNHPEYQKRKEAVVNFAQKKKLIVIDKDDPHSLWLSHIKGYEKEPEKGKRCSLCFDMRLQKTAQYAHEQGYTAFATTNGFSTYKDRNQVDISGLKASLVYPNLLYWGRNWRKGNALYKASLMIKEENFYRQKYCGCEFSKRKTANQ